MNKLATLAATLSVGLVPGFALAQANQDNPSGAYVGTGWGQLNLDVDNLSDVGTAAGDIINSRDNAWKVFAGWRFNPYFSLEAAYIDFGKHSDRFLATGSNGNYRISMTGFAPYAIGTLPAGNFDLFAKAGIYYYDVKVQVDFDRPGPQLNSSHSRNDFVYAFGVGYTFIDHLNVRAEYETVEAENAKHSNAVWLSAAWRF